MKTLHLILYIDMKEIRDTFELVIDGKERSELLQVMFLIEYRAEDMMLLKQ